MCLILDANVVHKVFGADIDYQPVRTWITSGKGKLIFGGNSYNNEVSKLSKYTKIFAELSRQNRIVKVDDELVDSRETQVRAIEPRQDFDDPHLVALIIVSQCKIICTDDSRADKYLKDDRFYQGLPCSKPSIYRNRDHAHLLCDTNIIGKCK